MKTSYCRWAMLLSAGCLLLLCGLAIGGDKDREAFVPRPDRMRVGLDVLVDGEPLRTITHRGRIYLPVPRMGAEYQIRVWNHGPRRISAIVSVDGLSVINGRAASEASPGYIVSPRRSILIKGWRRSLDQVAAFHFVDREDSYAARTGRPENVGVIGLLAFEEQVPLPLLREEKGARSAGGEVVARKSGEHRHRLRARDRFPRRLCAVCPQREPAYHHPLLRHGGALRKAGELEEPPMPIPFPDSQEFAPPPPGYKGH